MNLKDDLQYLKGVGPRRLDLLKKLGIYTLEDLLFYVPRDHEDRQQMLTISQLEADQVQSIQGTVVNVQERRMRKGLNMLQVKVSDDTGVMTLAFFNQPFLKKQFVIGNEYIFTGKVVMKYGVQMQNLVFERLSDMDEENRLNTGRIVPVYALTDGLTQRALRRIIKNACDQVLGQVTEILPQHLVEEHSLMDRCLALREIHFPTDAEHLAEARKRLIFEEFFILQVALIDKKHQIQDVVHEGISCSDETGLVKMFWDNLPFTLTGAQQRVIEDIKRDMQSERVMNRLVQGDVGSGKTIVAIFSMMLCIQNGYQVAFMAPTEILADQHFQSLLQLIDVFHVNPRLLVGSTKKKEREEILKELADGTCHLVVGTHALIQDDVQFHHLGLGIVDEQHKFGVVQRSILQEKGAHPHVLVMTATPIPRTLSMTVYGDLDVSIMDELPAGRKYIKTFWITEKKRSDMYGFIDKEIESGRQVYCVYPLVEKSEKLDLKAAEERYLELKEDIFPQRRVGMVHGRMKAKDKEAVMLQFKRGDLDILVSTTVIEVGVDVPNSTIMLIEDATRFGLAQLHQLRGRVGRGEHQSFCFLMGVAKTDEAKARMKVMCETTDGFKIAEADLQIRGPGEFFGFRQSGLPELRVGSIVTDIILMEKARQAAIDLFDHPERRAALKGLLHMAMDRYGQRMAIAGVA